MAKSCFLHIDFVLAEDLPEMTAAPLTVMVAFVPAAAGVTVRVSKALAT